MATYSYKPPTRQNVTTDSIRASRSVREKARIWQEFAHTILLDELSLEASDTTKKTNKIETRASMQFPLIKINDYIVSNQEITSMKIDCTEFLPRITLICTFLQHTFISREMPKDGDIISIAIRNKSDVLKGIRNDYVITRVHSAPNSGTKQGISTIMTFFGFLYVPKLMTSKRIFSHIGTSLDTMREYAKSMNLGFAHNENDTEDKQVWLYTKHGNSAMKFPEWVSSAAYKDEKSFFAVWIDLYYNLNFVNLNKQLMGTEDDIDPAAWLNNIDKDFYWGEYSKQDEAQEIVKVFSNYPMFMTSPFFIRSWKPDNRSSSVTFNIGTKTWCQLFEHNQGLYEEEDSQKFWKMEMEPTYDPEKVYSHILLRGRPTQDPNNKGKELTRANYDYSEIYARYVWMGVQYTLTNSDDDHSKWDGNQHPNYHRAKIQNFINLKELEKLNVIIQTNGFNLNVIKGDKMPVILIKKDPVQNRIIDEDSKGHDMPDRFYSGWYLVKGFVIEFTRENDESIESNFSQSFILTRREWPPPVDIEPVPKKSV